MTSHNNRNCITIGVISIRFSNPRPLESQFIEGTNESTARVDSLVALMHHDPSDLGSLTLIQITDPTVLFYSIAPTLSKHCSELTFMRKSPLPFLSLRTLFSHVSFQKQENKKAMLFTVYQFPVLDHELYIALGEYQLFINIDNSAKTLGIQWAPTLQPLLIRPRHYHDHYSGLNESSVSHFVI